MGSVLITLGIKRKLRYFERSFPSELPIEEKYLAVNNDIEKLVCFPTPTNIQHVFDNHNGTVLCIVLGTRGRTQAKLANREYAGCSHTGKEPHNDIPPLGWALRFHDFELFHALRPLYRGQLDNFSPEHVSDPRILSLFWDPSSTVPERREKVLKSGDDERHPITIALFFQPQCAWDLVMDGWNIPNANLVCPLLMDTPSTQVSSAPEYRDALTPIQWMRWVQAQCLHSHLVFPFVHDTDTRGQLFHKWIDAYDKYLASYWSLCVLRHGFVCNTLDSLFVGIHPLSTMVYDYVFHPITPLSDRREKEYQEAKKDASYYV